MAPLSLLLVVFVALLAPAASVVDAAYCFSYTFNGRPVSGNAFSIVANGILTTNASVTAGSRGAALITGVSGTRIFTQGSTSQTLSFTGVNTVAARDNIVYGSYPYTSTNGWSFSLNGNVQTAYGTGDATVAVVTSFDPLLEITGSPAITTYVGDLTVKFDQSVTSVSQCNVRLTNPTPSTIQYSFCYTIASDGTDQYSQNGVAWTTSGYGLFTGSNPVEQEGRAAIILTSMQGYRTLTVNGTTYSQQIVALKGDMQDWTSSSGLKTDNYFYLSAPYLDQYGLLFTLDSNVIYPDGVSTSADINFEFDQYGSLQYLDLNGDTSHYLQSSRQWFDYQPYTGSGAISFSACPGAPVSWYPSGQSASSSSSSSSLSGGAIAGIVIGVVVAAILLVAVLIYLITSSSGRSGKSLNTPKHLNTDTDTSVESSQVELQA